MKCFSEPRWAEVLSAAHPGEDLTLLEIASGDADMIPQMMARAASSQPLYHRQYEPDLDRAPARENEIYRLKSRSSKRMPAEIDRHLPAESVDIIAFQHAVNDVHPGDPVRSGGGGYHLRGLDGDAAENDQHLAAGNRPEYAGAASPNRHFYPCWRNCSRC